jgi:deoxyribonuclease-4
MPLGSNRDRHANIGEGLLGEDLGVFLASSRLQGLPAVLETAGPEKQGPDAKELEKTRQLRERALARA